MNNKKLTLIEIFALSLSIIATILAMLYSAAWQIDSSALLFILWAISPYICLFLVDILLRKLVSVSKQSLVFCVVSVLMLGFTLVTYGGVLGNKSSTFALVFLFVPVYLYIGAIVLLGVGLILAFLLKPSKIELN